MVLISRNANIMPAAIGHGAQSGVHQSAKRSAGHQLQEKNDKENAAAPGGEPKPKRAAIGYDYDAENIGDEENVPEYAFDIFLYYRQREKAFVVSDYLKKQHKITRDARAILVDWMVEVQESFELNHETLYLAVKLVDLYFSRTNDIVYRTQLQLIACAAIFIASKYDERSPPPIDEFVYAAADTFCDDDLKTMEMKMLKTVEFDLGSPLSYRFLRRYAKASRADMQILTVSRYVLETSLLCYEYARSSESEVAAGAFLLGLRMRDASAQWTPIMHKYSGVGAAVAEAWCWQFNHMMHVRNANEGVNARLQTCYLKYSHEVFFSVALIPLLEDRFSKCCPLQAVHRA